ncbi:hypothetical protein QBC39DRAFT_147551 [Podospora conica]|nr:hypothetical protein QBC39DRAFT_147551 [Schizothecium conicum]
MALQAAYRQFLAAPNSSALASNASLHYITSTTSFAGATEIIKHFGTLRSQVKKKKESAITAVEGQSAIAVEIETTLEFVSSGGPYLPGLDDNFVADRTCYLPITHFVTFDAESKILQIRQSWDQGALLKQLDVIGKTGRNWPIRDSKEQIILIARCVKPAEGAPASADLPSRSRGNSNNIMRDPHASLTLFAPREEIENAPPASVVSPYAGNRPRQRSFTQILGDEPEDEDDDEPSPNRGRGRSQSPSKGKAIAPKSGAGKNFQPIRLFETDEEHQPETPEKPSPEKFVRPDPRKYQHFDFADGTDSQDAPRKGVDFAEKPKTKKDAMWSFEDFTTPQKPTASRVLHKARDVRHWGTENDVVEETPEKRGGAPAKARPDAEPHFEFVDDGPDDREHRAAGHPRGTAHNDGLGLYENNLYNEDGTAPTPGPGPLGNITNLGGRHKDFDPHFAMDDESPSGSGQEEAPKDQHKKAVRMMESNWSSYDKSPVSHKENSNPHSRRGPDERGIVIGGDGMGGKKGTNRDWLFGDEAAAAAPSVPGKQQKATGPKSDNFWDF